MFAVTSGVTYNIVYIIVGAGGAFFAVGEMLLQLIRYIERRAVKKTEQDAHDAKIDTAIAKIDNLESKVNELEGRAVERMDTIDAKVTPNGGNTNEIGDIAKRSEAAIKALQDSIDGLIHRFDSHLNDHSNEAG